jgi:hypothetical protein
MKTTSQGGARRVNGGLAAKALVVDDDSTSRHPEDTLSRFGKVDTRRWRQGVQAPALNNGEPTT